MSTSTSVHQLYERLETVGKGAYGSVHKGRERATGNIVALKIINLDTEDDDVGDIQREVALLTQLRDAVNITKYFGCYMDGPRVWIVMEYASGGSVRTLMKACKDGKLEERYIVIIVREMLLALSFLHKMYVIHRDIKAANILVTAAGKVMLCDFGVSALLVTAQSKRNTLVGTPYWMAPEVAQPTSAYDTKADIWSLGITIYEMVTSSPPYANLQGFKVVQLIPRSKPPILVEGEGSRDLREFVATCLRELPADRPSADELFKNKWIKATAKMPVSILKDLIVRYESWQQAGGSRASLADPLGWEDEEEADLQNLSSNVDENPWEFDTVRGLSSSDIPSSRSSFDLTADDLSDITNVRNQPAFISRVPISLRGLFDDVSTPPSDPFRMPSSTLASSDSSNLSQSTFLSPVRDRAAIKRTLTQDDDDIQTARPNNSASPPRTFTPRDKAKSSVSMPTSEDETISPSFERRRPPPPALGPGIPRGTRAAPIATSASSSSLSSLTMAGSMSSGNSGTSTGTFKVAPTYRDVRTSRGVPDISIPPANSQNIGLHVAATSPATLPSASEVPVTPPVPELGSRPIFNRQRSQSSAATTSSSRILGTSVFPVDFHFPQTSSTAAIAGPPLPYTEQPAKTVSSLSSNQPKNPLTHQSTHSLDHTIPLHSPRRPQDSLASQAGAEEGLGLPPSLSRAHSANAAADAITYIPSNDMHASPSRRPSLNRQASVAVMETVQSTAFIPTSKPYLRNGGALGTSEGNAPSQPVNLPALGLRNVVKIPTMASEIHLGHADLLPPSPSVALPSAAFAAPPPSSLGSNFITNDLPSWGTPISPFFTQHQPRNTTSPSPDETSRPADASAVFSSSSSRTYSHNTTSSFTSSSSSSSASSLLGPNLRPLDLGALLASHDDTHAELGRTVDELVQWLNVVEMGLSSILDKATLIPSTSIKDEPLNTDQRSHDRGYDPDPDEVASHDGIDEHVPSEGLGIGIGLNEFLELNGDEDGIGNENNWDSRIAPSSKHPSNPDT